MADIMAGLGIDFNPPPSPPRNPHIARLQGRDLSRRPLPSAPGLRHAISLDALNLDRRVRIADSSPELIGHGEPVEEDYGEDGDERYLDSEEEDNTSHHRRMDALSRSQVYYDHVSRGRPHSYHPTYDVRRQPYGGAHGMQRPHSMMELADLYSAQSIRCAVPNSLPLHRADASSHSSGSPDDGTISSPSSHETAFSPEESPATSVSPSSCLSGKAAAAPFVVQPPSQRIVHARQASETTQHAIEALHRARVASEAAQRPPAPPAPATRPSIDETLQRQSTLIASNAHPARRQKDLNRLLAPGTALKRKASTVVLEQAAAKGKARVELDVVLESALVVEGGMLRGRMEVCIRGGGTGAETEVWVSNPKARVVGFEGACDRCA
jgi:hypothetical protein